MNVSLSRLALAAAFFAAVTPALAQEEATAQVSLSIFEARVRSFAPGIDAIISLSDEQKTQLGEIYGAVFGTTGVRLAEMVLQDSGASAAQRQMATATVLQAQADFRTRSRGVFTDEQRQLIDRVYETFNRVYQAAEKAMVQQVTEGFAAELERMLTAEQKTSMERQKAEIAKAAENSGEADQPGDEP